MEKKITIRRFGTWVNEVEERDLYKWIQQNVPPTNREAEISESTKPEQLITIAVLRGYSFTR